MKVFFSIIIPVYNAEDFLDRTIQSVLNQSYKNYELILVDDCSTDDSFRIAQKYQNIYSHVQAMQMSANSGSANLPIQKGLEHVHGDFVLVLGNDDVINEIYLEKIHSVICAQDDVEIVIPFVKAVNAGTDDVLRTYPMDDFDMSIILSGYEACRMEMPQWTFSCNGMAFHKDLIRYIKEENPYTYSNSDEFSSRILLYHAQKVAFSKSSEYTYYLYPTSITHKRSVKLFETLYTDTHLISFAEKYYGRELVTEMCTKMLSNMICLYKDYRKSKDYSLEEREVIEKIFDETYAFLQSKKNNILSIKYQFYLSKWLVFKGICAVMSFKNAV